MPNAWDVVGLGENSVDFVYRLPSSPSQGAGASKIRISGHSVLYGGQVATTLCTCVAMGASAAYIGAFGNDANGARLREEIATRGVDVDRAAVRRATNRYAVILVDDASGERIVLWHRDDALVLGEDDVPEEVVRRGRLLHVDASDEAAAIRAAGIARRAGLPVTCDIDRVTARTRELLDLVTIPILAEHVPRALTGGTSIEAALRAIRQWHAGWLCVTLGARGAVMLEGDRVHQAAGFPVRAVDTTGAGDVFRGAFIAALLRGENPGAILRFACAAAALSCTRPGAIGSIPARHEVDALAVSA